MCNSLKHPKHQIALALLLVRGVEPCTVCSLSDFSRIISAQILLSIAHVNGMRQLVRCDAQALRLLRITVKAPEVASLLHWEVVHTPPSGS